VDAKSYRAGDADRERMAERLRVALEEGRLNLQEYDERLREAYAARTYADLDKLVADIPGAASAAASQVIPSQRAELRWQAAADGRYPDATRRWVLEQWNSWIRVLAICVAIWATAWIVGGEATFFWPVWVAGPWGALLLVQTINGLLSGEPQRWAAKQARKEAEREVRRANKPDKDAADSEGTDAD
jgi:hypothetical protein